MDQSPILILPAPVPSQQLHMPGGEDIPHSHVSQAADIPHISYSNTLIDEGERELWISFPFNPKPPH